MSASLPVGGSRPQIGPPPVIVYQPAEPKQLEITEERFGMLRSALRFLPEHPVIGFAACPGTTAGHAMHSFGSELAAEGRNVVVADLAEMQHITHDEVAAFDPDSLIMEPDRLFHWRREPCSPWQARRRGTPASSDARISLVELLRSGFDYTLLEAPALDTGLKPVLLAALSDAVILVVEAGKCRTSQVQRARKILEMVNANVAGCVLTGRRYPVPEWLYKRLG